MKISEIKEYLNAKKITYPQLASMTGLSLSTITKIFGGFAKYPRVDTMDAIEQALGLRKQNGFPSVSNIENDNFLVLYASLSNQQKEKVKAFTQGLLSNL